MRHSIGMLFCLMLLCIPHHVSAGPTFNEPLFLFGEPPKSSVIITDHILEVLDRLAIEIQIALEHGNNDFAKELFTQAIALAKASGVTPPQCYERIGWQLMTDIRYMVYHLPLDNPPKQSVRI